MSALADLPRWIAPGDAATLLWHSGRGVGRDGVSRYQIAGPALETAPPTAHFLLAPVERGDFAGRLYRGEVAVEAVRDFLGSCTLVEGRLDDSLEWLAARAEAPALPVLDGWRAVDGRPLLPYLSDIGAFLPGPRPLFVGAEAVAAARGAPELFSTAWVCDECGQAEDAAAFLWTARGAEAVRVCFLIQNDAGVWTCRFHPFDFVPEPA